MFLFNILYQNARDGKYEMTFCKNSFNFLQLFKDTLIYEMLQKSNSTNAN